ncbi:MAG: VTT domain-containing protein [Chloroflexi bacterium]|nr:VTT domain-containing protein [Chloroflexota bacterium]MBU1748854.1 VTT domain-containing protein [Chloroflexota bacterium]
MGTETHETGSVGQTQRAGRRLSWRLLALPAVMLIIVLLALLPIDYAALQGLGYVGIALINFIASAGFVLPVPNQVANYAAGATLNPLLVGVVAGVASALGDLTGYYAGLGVSDVLEGRRAYDTARAWMQRRGMVAIFLLSIIPNPFFDIGGAAAGAVRLPVWRFLLACALGRSIRDVLTALAGYYSAVWVWQALTVWWAAVRVDPVLVAAAGAILLLAGLSVWWLWQRRREEQHDHHPS